MFNYKRLTFVFIFISFLLTVTDSSLEKQARRALLSLVNIVVEEGSDVSSTAPSSFLDNMESGRLGLYNFLDKQGNTVNLKSMEKKGFVSGLLTVVYFLIQFLKFICNYVITFYPVLILIFYMFLTSRLFRRNDYYENYYGNY